MFISSGISGLPQKQLIRLRTRQSDGSVRLPLSHANTTLMLSRSIEMRRPSVSHRRTLCRALKWTARHSLTRKGSFMLNRSRLSKFQQLGSENYLWTSGKRLLKAHDPSGELRKKLLITVPLQGAEARGFFHSSSDTASDRSSRRVVRARLHARNTCRQPTRSGNHQNMELPVAAQDD